MVRVDIGDSAQLIEVTSHRHHPEVLGGELDLRVIRVQLPVAHGEPPCSPPVWTRHRICRSVAIVAGFIAAGCVRPGWVEPVVDAAADVLPLNQATQGLETLTTGNTHGKVVARICRGLVSRTQRSACTAVWLRRLRASQPGGGVPGLRPGSGE